MAVTTANATFSQNADGSINVQIGPYSFTTTKRQLKQAMRETDLITSFLFQSIQALSNAGVDPDTATLAQIQSVLQTVNYVLSV